MVKSRTQIWWLSPFTLVTFHPLVAVTFHPFLVAVTFHPLVAVTFHPFPHVKWQSQAVKLLPPGDKKLLKLYLARQAMYEFRHPHRD